MDFGNITFPEQILDYIAAGGMIMISAIIIIAFILLMRYAAKLLPGLLALLIYLVVAYAGVEVLTGIMVMLPGLNQLLTGSIMWYCAIRAILMALLMHLTRWIVLKFANKNSELELGTAMMAGLGAAIGQTILSGMDMIAWWTIGDNINVYGINDLLQGMEVEQAQEYVDRIEAILALPENFFLLKGISNTVDIVFQVAVCVIMYALIKNGVKVFWHWVIIGLSAVLSLTTLVGDYGITDQYMTLTLIKLAVIVTVIIVALRMDRVVLNGELSSFSKLKTGKSMPKFNNLKNK